MKAKELVPFLTWRRAPKVYGVEVVDFDLPTDGRIQYAQWLHPLEHRKTVTQATIDEMRRILAPGDVAIDIGARTGDTALPMALAVGPAGAVFALEPNRYAFRVLEVNAGLNPTKTNIIALPFAATKTDGPLEFHYTDLGFHNGGRHRHVPLWRHGRPFKLPVEGRNLQAHLKAEHPERLDRVRFIKVDTEGEDDEVLMTLADLLQRARPMIRAEVFKHTGAARRRALLDFLSALDYDVFVDDEERTGISFSVDALRRRDGARLTVDNLMRIKCFDIFCLPRERALAP